MTLEDANRDAIIADTEDTAITKAFDDVQTAVAREIGCGWADYDLSTDFRAARVTGKRAHVVVVVDTDYRYAASPEIDSGIYNVRYDVRLAQHGDDWRIVGIRSDNADHLRFEGAVALRVADGKSVREAARELREERIAALPGLARELGSVSGAKPSEPSTAEDAGTVAATVQPMAAASYSYSASRGDEYAERFATTQRPLGYYYADRANCTNFVSQCVWAAYGGYVSGNDTASRNNMLNKVRMVPNVWQAGTGGGTPNWESVSSFWTYTVNSTKTRGPMATGYNNGAKYTGIAPADVRVGNVFQVRRKSHSVYRHSVYVTMTIFGPLDPPTWSRVYVSQHTPEVKNRMASELIEAWGGDTADPCFMRRLVFRSGTFDK